MWKHNKNAGRCWKKCCVFRNELGFVFHLPVYQSYVINFDKKTVIVLSAICQQSFQVKLLLWIHMKFVLQHLTHRRHSFILNLCWCKWFIQKGFHLSCDSAVITGSQSFMVTQTKKVLMKNVLITQQKALSLSQNTHTHTQNNNLSLPVTKTLKD